MSAGTDQVRAAYGATADLYIELFGSTAAVHPADLALIERHVSVGSGVVLDVGCGPGHLTEHLHSMGVDAWGIDVVPEFIDHARARSPDCRFELGTMQQLPVGGGTVVGIVAWYSLIHLRPDEFDPVLRELRRAAAPGAALVVGFFPGDEIAAFEHKVTTAYCWPADELAARLRRAGFEEVERRLRPADAAAGIRASATIAATAV